jgi:hypothetical protein
MLPLAQLKTGFAEPPLEFAPMPFWFLNAETDLAEYTRQLTLMRAAGVGGVVLHARLGHTATYLSEEWLAGIRHCVAECARLGLKAWLYDEDNFPSGYAGGAVLAAYPGGRAKCLAMDSPEQEGDTPVATMDGHVFVQRLTPWHPAYSTDWYVDLMDPEVTATFLRVNHEVYAEALGELLGTTVTAIFTDEPGFYNHFYDCAPDTVVWTPDLPEQFQQRMGYDLIPHLPALFTDTPDCATVRRDFYKVVSALMAERFYAPIKDWCHAHGIQSVGHVNNEELLVDHARLNADYFSAMDGLDMPGLDIIAGKEDYRRAPDSIVPRLTASTAHVRGQSQVMSETYGAAGWDLAPGDMRRIADWLAVRGVTRIVPHAFYQSTEDFRYNECPPSFFFQSPHWPYMPALMKYLSRLCWMLEGTRPTAPVAVHYPIDAVRGVTSPQVPPSLGNGLDEGASEAGRLSMAFRELTDTLFRGKVDYEVVDDRALAEASFAEGRMQVRDLCFKALVLPPGAPSSEAAAVIQSARDAGVPVLEGAPGAVLAATAEWAVARLEPASPQLTVARRRAVGGEVFFVVNEGEAPYVGTLELPAVGVVTNWDVATGQMDPWPAEQVGGVTRIPLQLLEGAAVCFSVASGACC